MVALNIKFLIFSILLIVLNHKAYALRCLPLANPTCTEPFCAGSTGPGCVRGTRWSYNPSLLRCVAFTYQGCAGNTNRYCSRAACLRNCRPPIPRVVVG
ncbi:PREDICTED: male accessory gland serine protease inhibitor-like [Rhagoletis zephyria]|uniref:male accessory gland serine protease inhibitor-like n=1 Tax=Rhagoletis zephyria TaxID=28612 RepID=UPI000811494C|nr:PREDICTED: male accessory gland serine protease inhibitor-like [Rhagoletis zephyria]XP_036322604.1 male accessory gland serine protease inhibitor-like [Rhagoletis pomonella]